MKSNRHIDVFVLLLFLLFTQSCEKEGPDGIGGPWVKGTLQGTVEATDEFGRAIEDRSNFSIHVESAGLSATTDFSGKCYIDSLPTGTYDISCTKEGFIDDQVVSYTFIGGGIQTCNFYMFPRSTSTIDDLELEENDDGFIMVYGTISPFSEEDVIRSMVLFLNNTDNVQYNNYLYYMYVDLYPREFEANGYFSAEVPSWSIPADIYHDNINTYYAKAYGIALREGGYPDIETGLVIFPSLNEEGGSNVATLTIN